jgi:hypothetical protein
VHEILYIASKDMLILSSTVELHYYNCCTDGSTSTGNYGYPLAEVWQKIVHIAKQFQQASHVSDEGSTWLKLVLEM